MNVAKENCMNNSRKLDTHNCIYRHRYSDVQAVRHAAATWSLPIRCRSTGCTTSSCSCPTPYIFSVRQSKICQGRHVPAFPTAVPTQCSIRHRVFPLVSVEVFHASMTFHVTGFHRPRFSHITAGMTQSVVSAPDPLLFGSARRDPHQSL